MGEEAGFRGRRAGDSSDERSCSWIGGPGQRQLTASGFQFLTHGRLCTRLTVLALKSNFEFSQDVCTAHADKLSDHWNDAIQMQRAEIFSRLLSDPNPSSAPIPVEHPVQKCPLLAQNKCHEFTYRLVVTSPATSLAFSRVLSF